MLIKLMVLYESQTKHSSALRRKAVCKSEKRFQKFYPILAVGKTKCNQKIKQQSKS